MANSYIRTNSAILTLFTAAVWAIVAAAAWIAVNRETNNSRLTLATMHPGHNAASFFADASTTVPCFGAITAEASLTEGHYSVIIAGWIHLEIGPRRWIQEISGTLEFNPLDQLGGSVFNLPAESSTLRIGTTSINPISFHLLRVTPQKSIKLIKQELPGPVLLHREPDLLRITAPNPTGLDLAAPLAPLLAAFPIHVESPPLRSCKREESKPLPVGRALTSLLSLRDRLLNQRPELQTP